VSAAEDFLAMISRRNFFVAAASALLAGCSPLRLLNASAADDSFTLREGLSYGPLPRHRFDLFVPRSSVAGPVPIAGWPVAVFFYGGSWNRGARADYRFVGEALASRGILTAIADYRLYPEVRYPDFLHDCARITALTLHEAGSWGGDPARVHVMGHSAGAYNAAMLALDERWLTSEGASPRSLAGWVGLAGPYDFLPISNSEVQPVFHYPDSPPDSQPLMHVHKGSPRAFLGAARSDSLVDPQRNTVALAAQLHAEGVPVEVKLYGRVDHAALIATLARPLRWLAPVLDDVSGFMLGVERI